MDEVIVDFVGGALKAHGWTRERLEQKWERGTWSIVESMGYTQEQFWQPINALQDVFWIHLEPHPWMHDLLRTVKHFSSEWYIVTSPSLSPWASQGKVTWLQRHFGRLFTNYVITNHKHLLACLNRVLIDDREATIDKFRLHDGKGIIFPSRHNSLHSLANDPVQYIHTQLKEHCDALSLS
jgi:5'(3')-deoxyribonucleotidase